VGTGDGDLVSGDLRARFAADGVVVLRGAVDPAALSDEVDRSLAEGVRGSFTSPQGGGITGAYVPMMVRRTAVSLSLLDRFAAPAAALLGRPVLPVRAKGTRYAAGAGWHRDSVRPVASVGFVCYLEPLTGDRGALRVQPGSHRAGWDDDVELSVDVEPGLVIETDPGDVVCFDEHLLHASTGGRDRRQWRVDYVEDPDGPEAFAAVEAYLAALFSPDWDGGYDVDAYPSYDADWRASGRPGVARLGELGAYAAAEVQEANARSRRP